MRLFGRKPKEHRAAVHGVRPLPDDPKPFDPYFVALCDCDWFGTPRTSGEEAFRDAYSHTPNVEDEIQRPVG